MAAIQAEVARAGGGGAGAAGGAAPGAGRGGNTEALWAALHRPEDRDPRAFVIPSDQPDFPTATKFVNALLETGIDVRRATAGFTAAGKSYPAGSYVVLTAQAFRPHVMDMFEPQDHPDNFPYQGAPPTPPYDNAGWTLAYQMGVEFDRILDGVTGPFERIPDWNIAPPPVPLPAAGAVYTFSPVQLDAFVAANRLAAAGAKLERFVPTGEFSVAVTATTLPVIRRAAAERGVRFRLPPRDAIETGGALKPPRIGLWDRYGGSMDAGWTRWILEQFEFPFTRVFVPELDAGNLNAKYDVLIFVTGALPGSGGGGRGGGGAAAGRGGAGPTNVPAEYANQVGSVSVDRTMPQIKQFLDKGGTVVAIGSSATNLAAYLGLPMRNHLAASGPPPASSVFYVPGSVLRARVDTTRPVAAGMKVDTDVFFDNSPVWALDAGAEAAGLKRIAWFDSKTPLRSGWAWGQERLEGGVIAVEAPVGAGRVYLFGPEILQRGQPHGTFKFLFNAIWASK
jgi:hypothetical protein